MKTFTDIVKLNQMELKAYLKKYLLSKKYEPKCEDGFLYAKGNIPILLVAHMDTVHKDTVKEIKTVTNEKGQKVYSSPQGIGGDDRCGCYIIMECIKEGNRPSVLFLEDEEIGCVGAKKFTHTSYINNLDVNFMVELDRRGSKDAVFYSCDNKEFTKFIEANTDHKLAYGSCSDISTLMPASKIAGVNLSCGYYNEHTLTHTVVYEEVMDTLDNVIDLCCVCKNVEKPFEYVAKSYSYSNYDFSRYYSDVNRYGNYGMGSNYKTEKTPSKSKTKKKKKDTTLYMEVSYFDKWSEEDTYAIVTGNSKLECWMEFFETYSHVCMDDVIDYDFY